MTFFTDPLTFPLLPFLVAFAVSVAIIPGIIRMATRIGWLDRPGGVKAHKAPTPYGGGLGIAAGTAAGFLLAWGLGTPPVPATIVVVGAATLIFAGGIYDDFRPLGAWAKFAIQGAAAATLIAWDVRLHIALLPDVVNISLTVLWILGVTNAVNMIDIMDGLAASVTGIAAVTFGLIGLLFGESELAVPAFALAGALCGFLRYNFQPARIFMGDAGAQFIGFLLAALSIQGSYTTFNEVALLSPILILGVPIFDTVLITVLRIRKGRSPFLASNDHLAIRLRRMGFGVRDTVRVCVFSTVVLAGAATATTLSSLPVATAIYVTTTALALVVAWRVSRVPVE